MKRNTTAAATAAEKNTERLEKMRAGLAAIENRADELLSRGDDATPAERRELLSLVNVAYHDSGKIEGVFSIDSSAACEFCKKMRHAAEYDVLLICGYCYAAADEWKEAAWRRHKLNSRILSSVLFSADELRALPVSGTLLRINEDGDTPNATYARNIIRLASVLPGCNVGYWFKNWPAVETGLIAEGYTAREALPENIRFIQSSIRIGFADRPVWFADAVFTVYPDAETTAAAIAAGAHECNGRRCRACGYHCYTMRRPAAAINIAEVLRAGKARRSAVLAAYNARLASLAARE